MIIRNKISIFIYAAALGTSLILSRCSTEEEEEEEEEVTDINNTIPKVQAINVSGLGTSSSTSLLADPDCTAASDQGIFGLILYSRQGSYPSPSSDLPVYKLILMSTQVLWHPICFYLTRGSKRHQT